MRDDDLYILNERTERHATIVGAVGLALIIAAAVLSVQCGKTAPVPAMVEPPWPPPPTVVDALPVQATPSVADFATVATPAADPSPVTTTAVWRTDPL